jgi:lipopolysaccharide biosynthesis glycosyltransferase
VEPLRIAVAAEATYAPHSAAMLHSVMANAGGLPVEVHYLHGPEFPADAAAKIGAMLAGGGARVSFHSIDPDRVAGLPVVDQFTVAMWYRTLLPDLLPDADRVLYLDVDTIAADSLEPLWRTDLGDHHVAAVTNVFMREHEHRPAELGLAGPEVYFNSGVLLMNLEAMRRERSGDALREFARDRELEWPDQDALNMVLGASRLALDPRWNVTNSMWFPWSDDVFDAGLAAAARERPGIRHFEGPGANKPWHDDFDHEHHELYFRHRRATPWPPARPLWRRAAGRVKRRLSA